MSESTSSAHMLKSFTVEETLKTAWELFKNNWKQLVIFGVVYLLVTQVPAMIVENVFGKESSMARLLGFVLAFWNVFVSLGTIKYMLAFIRGQKPEVMTLFSHTEQYVPFLIMYIRYMIVIIVGLVLFIIPGIYFCFKYAYVLMLVADGKADGSEAFKMSARMTEGKKLTMFIYAVVSAILVILGFVALVIPGLVAAGVVSIGGFLMYEYLLKHTSKSTAVEPEHIKG